MKRSEKSPAQPAVRAPPSPGAAGDPGEGIDFLFCLVRTAVLGMMGNVVRPARPPPLPQLCRVSGATFPLVREAGGGGEEDGARGAGRGGVLDARPGKKRKKS